MASLNFNVPLCLASHLSRPIFKPLIIHDCAQKILPECFLKEGAFESLVIQHLGELQVTVVRNNGERVLRFYKDVLDIENEECISIIDQMIPKGNPILELLEGFPLFEDDILPSLMESLGRTHTDSRLGILFSSKHFFSASHMDPMCQMGWMLLVTGEKTWHFWNPHNKDTMSEWKKCLTSGSSQMPNPHISFVAKAGSMVFIPPGWPHAVSTKTRSIGICGSMVTTESLFRMPFFWDEHRRVYPEDNMPSWKHVEPIVSILHGWTKKKLCACIKDCNTVMEDMMKKDDDDSCTITNLSTRRGPKTGRKRFGYRSTSKFGKRPRGDKRCEDPEHDPALPWSCGRHYKSFSYNSNSICICKACYDRNKRNKAFHEP